MFPLHFCGCLRLSPDLAVELVSARVAAGFWAGVAGPRGSTALCRKMASFQPPAPVAAAARRALERRAQQPASNRGMTPVGLARARQLANRQELSPTTIDRMVSYFARHEVDKQGSSWGTYGKGRQAWDGWGGDPGQRWARTVARRMDAAERRA